MASHLLQYLCSLFTLSIAVFGSDTTNYLKENVAAAWYFQSLKQQQQQQKEKLAHKVFDIHFINISLHFFPLSRIVLFILV